MQNAETTGIAEEALIHLRALLSFDTTNPPGDEIHAARYIESVLRKEGFDPVILEPEKGRGNLVVRLKGDGSMSPLLLASHLDVVPAGTSEWELPPFAAQEKDGYIFGRGTLDMKHMTAMSLMTLLQLRRSGVPLKRDVILAAVADEETHGRLGAGFLVREHPELIRSEFALCEVGGCRLRILGKTYFPVQIAERGVAYCRVRFRGEAAHASFTFPHSAINQMAVALSRLRSRGLPRHLCVPARRFFQRITQTQGFLQSCVLSLLLTPSAERLVLSLMDQAQARVIYSFLHPSASPTIVTAGETENMHPSMAEVIIDGRTLPGQTFDDFRQQLQSVLGDSAEIELIEWMEPLSFPPTSELLNVIRGVLQERDPESVLLPYMNPGYTDAKHFDKIGITTYGFVPMYNDTRDVFSDMVHATNEKIQISAFSWGVETLLKIVERFCGGGSMEQAASKTHAQT